MGEPIFQDRRDAGQALVRAMAAIPYLKDAVVLALPRGGVPVAFEIARAHNLPLDILAVRKLGVPGQEELAMGAIAGDGTLVLNSDIIQAYRISDELLRAVSLHEQREIERDEGVYRAGQPPLEIADRTVILVDDGLATGATMRAAVRVAQPRSRRVIIAVPVAAVSTCRELRSEVDRIICAFTPEPFEAVGRFYRDFAPTSNDEVRALLLQARKNLEARSAA